MSIGRLVGSNILFSDIIDGPLILMPKKIIELIETKYTTSPMVFTGLYRTELTPYPKPAIREAVMNSLMHCDYSKNNGIQIKMYPEDMTIYNDGGMGSNWTVDNILRKHPSLRRNPSLAEVFFRAGMVERFGRGIGLIMDEYKGRNAQPPMFEINEYSFSVTFADETYGNPKNPLDKSIPEHMPMKLTAEQMKVMDVLKGGPQSITELMETISPLSKRKTFYWMVLFPMKEAKYIGLTIPDKPTSKNQKYHLISQTDKHV